MCLCLYVKEQIQYLLILGFLCVDSAMCRFYYEKYTCRKQTYMAIHHSLRQCGKRGSMLPWRITLVCQTSRAQMPKWFIETCVTIRAMTIKALYYTEPCTIIQSSLPINPASRHDLQKTWNPERLTPSVQGHTEEKLKQGLRECKYHGLPNFPYSSQQPGCRPSWTL